MRCYADQCVPDVQGARVYNKGPGLVLHAMAPRAEMQCMLQEGIRNYATRAAKHVALPALVLRAAVSVAYVVREIHVPTCARAKGNHNHCGDSALLPTKLC